MDATQEPVDLTTNELADYMTRFCQLIWLKQNECTGLEYVMHTLRMIASLQCLLSAQIHQWVEGSSRLSNDLKYRANPVITE